MSATVACQSASCPNGHPPSRLECPTCSKLGIRGSFFCGQECFKAGWKTHKMIHEIATKKSGSTHPDGTYNPFPNYEFTGTVRPVYPLSATRTVPEHIARPDYAQDGTPYSSIRCAGQPPRILSKDEQDKMRNVCKLGREVLDIAASHLKPGVTSDFIDDIVHTETIKRGAYPSPRNYRNYPKSVCISVNEVVCHGIPDQRKFQEGDIVNLDVTVYKDGLHGDLNETYAIGEIDADSTKLIRTTKECLAAGINVCRPGALIRDIGKAIEPVARANGCAVVRTYVGHGINDIFHASPQNVPHYAKNKAVGTMKPGMVFTVEPMINLGHNWGVVHWPDDWTAATTDGKRSAQFEHTLLITDTGVEVLTAAPEKP